MDKYHCEYKESHPRSSSPSRPAKLRDIETVSKDQRPEDLRSPIQHTVKSASPSVEARGVDRVELVDVEPIGAPEHGKEEDDIRLRPESFPEAKELRLPGGARHDDYFGAIFSDDIARVHLYFRKDEIRRRTREYENLPTTRQAQRRDQ